MYGTEVPSRFRASGFRASGLGYRVLKGGGFVGGRYLGNLREA